MEQYEIMNRDNNEITSCTIKRTEYLYKVESMQVK